MTTDRDVDKVTFIWKTPAGQVVYTETTKVYSNTTTFKASWFVMPTLHLIQMRWVTGAYKQNSLIRTTSGNELAQKQWLNELRHQRDSRGSCDRHGGRIDRNGRSFRI